MTQGQIGILIGTLGTLLAVHLTATLVLVFLLGVLAMAGLGKLKP